ncbi:hypothetical protein MFIFM68171_11233 [Madurella fahalii]|uniref:Ubiquitin 3 binding protein But2 C-terminal domain-containing protein n=1 Tax=Madurella fahalii TaxID=1157608 RepID=A0ABQ0GTF1_9PEZI
MFTAMTTYAFFISLLPKLTTHPSFHLQHLQPCSTPSLSSSQLSPPLPTLTAASPDSDDPKLELDLGLDLGGSLAPWQITGLSTHSPSGYPANHPYSRLSVSIGDPNTITLGPTRFGDAAFPATNVTCTVWWLAHSEDPRDGPWVNTCSETRSGKWTVEIRRAADDDDNEDDDNHNNDTGSSVTRDFVLRFGLSEAVVLGNGAVVSLRFRGEAAFAVGRGPDKNMEGACGGSGVCNWGLKDGVAPVLVNQTLVETRCVVGDCNLRGL